MVVQRTRLAAGISHLGEAHQEAAVRYEYDEGHLTGERSRRIAHLDRSVLWHETRHAPGCARLAANRCPPWIFDLAARLAVEHETFGDTAGGYTCRTLQSWQHLNSRSMILIAQDNPHQRPRQNRLATATPTGRVTGEANFGYPSVPRTPAGNYMPDQVPRTGLSFMAGWPSMSPVTRISLP